MSEPIRFRSVNPATRRPRRAAFLAPAVTLLLLVGQGCGGDGGSGVSENACIEFTAASSSASGNVITRASADSTCSLLVLEVVATGIDDVWALSTSVSYDSTIAAFDGWSTDGSILAQGGAQVVTNIGVTDTGLLTVGVSRVDAESGVDIDAGGGVLVELRFAPLSSTTGSGALGLSDECLLDSGTVDTGPAPIPGVSCYGGTLVVR